MPRLYAHRGASAELPENTIASFERALELGANALETDVHATSDGHIVISHDPTGERMCGVATAWATCTIDDVRRLDAGHGFVAADGSSPHRGGRFRVPTLDEMLAAFPDVTINIDIKAGPRAARPVVDLVRRHRAEQRVILASFSLRTMWRVRAAGYAGQTALSQPEIAATLAAPRWLLWSLPQTGEAVQVPLAQSGIDLTSPRLLDKWHDLGLRVDYWTVNDPDQARRLLARGADGIMTDDPRAIAPVFAGVVKN